MRTDIDANWTLVTDQTGKQRISRTNALGHLTDVWEITAQDAATVATTFPGTSIAYGYQTSYSFDTLNNLLLVDQGDQEREFTYTSLSRLTSAENPESGTIAYEFDNNGNLTEKTDSRGIVTSFAYDQLNQITDRVYTNEPSGSETPDVEYTYGTTAPKIGKLIKVESSVSTTEYTAFDILGRVTSSKQTTDGTDYTSGYMYNLAGALIEQTYPSGRNVKNVLDNSGDFALVQSKKNANSGYWNYASSFSYNAAGAVTSTQLGNGRWESTTFNSRLQPTQIALGITLGATNLLDLDYSYGTTANNGNVLSQTITVPNVGTTNGFMAVQTYGYDSLNRLKDAIETIASAETWKQVFTFDRYGNRNFVTGSGQTTTLGSCPTAVCNPTISTTNNRITSTGYSFDAAGNTTADAQGRTFVYDAENKQVEVLDDQNATIGEYFYDGDGRRIKKFVPSTGETTIFVYDAAARLVAEYSTIVASTQDAKVAYLTNDHLGSPRINTDINGGVTTRHDYHPFGEEISTSQRQAALGYADDTVRKQFTSYERDTETDLDFAQARYYSKNLGRFTSTDPILMKLARLADPQRINLYSYVRNNPFIFTDPKGMDLVLGEGDQKRIKKALVEIAKRKGGQEFLKKLDNLTIQIILTTGQVNEGKDYGRTGPKDPKNPGFTRVTTNGSVTDVKASAGVVVVLDFDRADKDRKENDKRKGANEAFKELGFPAKDMINVPASDAQQTGHELAHDEAQFFKMDNGEDAVDSRINRILQEPVDKTLAKGAENFVNELLKPKPKPEEK